jgi:hypothetical protein
MLIARIISVLSISVGTLPMFIAAAHAQTADEAPAHVAAPPASASPSPRLLLKAGLRLNHLFYQPGSRQSWQLVLPSSLGFEYRLNSQFSLYLQTEADISAGRATRSRRGVVLPTATTNLSLGARYYFNQSRTSGSQDALERWGNYVALEGSAELAQSRQLGRRNRAQSLGRVRPAVFALCGTQHAGAGHRMLYDLNAGIGLEVPASYASDPKAKRPWDVATQVNLRVYLVNHRRAPKPAKR